MNSRNSISAAVAAIFLALPVSGVAQSASPSARDAAAGKEASSARLPYLDTRLVLFDYSPDLTYVIHAKENLNTHFELEKGEIVQGIYPSDSTRWKITVAQNRERFFVRPLGAGLFNTVTLVTSRRTYELTLFSNDSAGQWFQRVKWSYPLETDAAGSGVFEEEAVPALPRGVHQPYTVMGSPMGAQGYQVPAGIAVDPKAITLKYKIDGDAPFRPEVAFDNGTFVWLRMPDKLQEMPAVFVLDHKGRAEIVNYSTDGQLIKIHRLAPGILLKLGDQEVRVTKDSNKSWFAARPCWEGGC